MDRNATILVVEDDAPTRSALCEYLGMAGYRVRTAASGGEGLAALQARSDVDAVLLDLVMPDMDGFELLRRYRASQGQAAVVVLSGLSEAENVVKAMKFGAADYLPKPFDPSELDLVLRRALDSRAPGRAGPRLASASGDEALSPPITLSAAMERVWGLAQRVADTDVPVLLVGESGVGKDVVARRIHALSHRADKPFVKINCAALPGELLESELFGHEKGAFTGAHAEKPGKFELANHGTIFLDEIGEMDPRLQAKLLQVLQDEEFYRVGGKRSLRVDARVLVATNRDLESEIEAGTFREDLYYRLNVVTLRVPPLRERKEDIEPLVHHFVEKYRRRYQGGLDRVPDDVMERFHAYDWPGNVRELENLVRRLVVLKDPSMVLGELTPARAAAPEPPHAAPAAPAPAPAGAALHAPLPEDAPLKEVGKRAARIAEREAIIRALGRTGWNKRKAAKRLQISYKALLYKIKDCEIVDPRNAALIE
ncbi:sigma-54-dependent transcriptional regulator [Anaeromyxobacter diazotrophicus]|uniref:Acetoacetate metabolism regulatory protein AtoC n=1 Tax=Anaeromyxobacter diazotrophicus TaxID=2590199 RepID=A0A7I9VIN7_9BACT|nr:sigma-54 dependent transcriptional regulator [Anaeromyxobacter diazotrophicus]GEJ56272.1 acetoacetate metabolism regulatory protein AtoC [Anaeromyxobacter diazotrophicus]